MNLKNFIKSKLESLDVFGVQTPLPLNIQGKQKMNSCLGLLMTFFTGIFLLVIIIIFMINFIDRSSPNVIQSNLKGVLEQEPFYVNKENNSNNSFNFGFGIEDADGNWFNDPSYFTVVPLYEIYDWDTLEYNSTNLGFQTCPDRFQLTGYCVASQDQNGDPAYVYHYADRRIHIYVQPCDNDTSNVTCQPQTDIDNKMGSSQLLIYNDNWSIDPLNYSSPMRLLDSLNTMFRVQLLPLQLKTIRLYLNKAKVVTDDGWLLESTRSQNVTTLENYIVDTQPRIYYTDAYAQFIIQTGCNEVIYNRKYTKIQDVLAQVDGLATFLFVIFSLLIIPYSKFKMQETLVNEVFQLRTQLKPSRNSKKSTRQVQETKEKDIQIEVVSENRLTDKTDPQRKSSQKSSDLSKTKAEAISATKNNSQIDDQEIIVHSKPINIELSPFEIKAISSRQHQPSPIAAPIQKELGTGETEITLKENNTNTQNSITAKLQGQDTLEPKPSHEVLDINPHINENGYIPKFCPEDDQPPIPEGPELALTPKIHISFPEWLLSLFISRPQVKMLEKANDELFKSLDIITLSQKIAQIDMLKVLLLTREQRILFEDISRKSLLYNPQENPKSLASSIRVNSWSEYNECNEEDLNEAYFMLKNSGANEALNQKLLSLYEKKCLQ